MTDEWHNQFGSGKKSDPKKSVWGKKLFGGQAGLKFTADKIVNTFPDFINGCNYFKTYVEPFAGKARTAKILMDRLYSRKNPYNYHREFNMVLNDISPHSNTYCRENFQKPVNIYNKTIVEHGVGINDDIPIDTVIVENMSFTKTISKYDHVQTFFFFDPPWRHNIYTYNDFFRMDRKVFEYYSYLLNVVDNLKGTWIITSNADEHECRKILTKSKWNTRLVSSDKNVIFGKKARTLLCSNMFGLKGYHKNGYKL